MSISKREIKIILYVVGILAVVLVWQFVYKPQVKSNEKIESEIAALQEDLNFLKGLEIREADLIAEREAAQAAQQEILSHFPANFYEEDVILHANDIEMASEMEISSISLSGQATAWSAEGNAVPYVLGTASAGYSFDVTYGDLKEVINGINADDDEYKSLDEVNLTYNADTGELYGSLSINHYFVLGTDKEYVSPDVSASYGTPNIFGTISGAGASSSTIADDVAGGAAEEAEGEEVAEGEAEATEGEEAAN